VLGNRHHEFESRPLRQVWSRQAATKRQILQDQILAGFFLFQGMAENSLKPVPEQVAEPENLRSRQATIYP
jgi:hypothetical protein